MVHGTLARESKSRESTCKEKNYTVTCIYNLISLSKDVLLYLQRKVIHCHGLHYRIKERGTQSEENTHKRITML